MKFNNYRVDYLAINIPLFCYLMYLKCTHYFEGLKTGALIAGSGVTRKVMLWELWAY